MLRRVSRSVPPTAFLAVLLAAGLPWGGPAPTALADGPAPAAATAEDDLVDLLLGAGPELRAALEDAVGARGAAGKAALERARHGPDPQRAWLAEAFATRAASRDSELPEMEAAFERATRVLRVFTGSAPGDDVRIPERVVVRRMDDALAILGEGDLRALPWVTSFCDRKGMPDATRLASARALVVRKVPLALGRLERVLEECPTAHRPNEMVSEIAATKNPEAVPLLLRIRSGATRVGDGAAVKLAEKGLAAMRSVPGFDEARAPWFSLVRRYEAEEAPLEHSTGAAVEGGWQAKHGRDFLQHMVYGPYATDLPSEELVARFRWRLDAVGPKAPQPLLGFEVTSEQMEKQGWPMQVALVGSGDATTGAWRETDIVFWPHPAPGAMQFRVHWKGGCDATVDRIDLLRVRPRNDADRAADPPRAEDPWRPSPAVPPLRPKTARALFEAAFALASAPPRPSPEAPDAAHRHAPKPLPSPGPWRTLRDLLLADPEASAVLADASKDASQPDRAWLADVWRVRLAMREAWDGLAARLDPALAWLLASTPSGHILGGVTPRAYEEELSRGMVAVAIEGPAPTGLPKGFAWAHALPDDRRFGAFGVERPFLGPLPSSALWRWILAEQWIAGPRGPLPPAGWVRPASSTQRHEIPVVPCTTGVIRLHALQHLAWLGEARARPALERLRDDPGAAPGERAAAERALAAWAK